MVCFACCLPSTRGAATENFVAAGMLLVAREQGAAYVLLGRDRYRDLYEMFGGRAALVTSAERDTGPRKETAYETAIRECHEESGGLLEVSFLRQISDPDQMIRDGGFIFFLAGIEKIAIERIKAAARLQTSPGFHEIADYAWVSVDQVFASEDDTVSDESGRRIRVRPELKSRLERARAAGWL